MKTFLTALLLVSGLVNVHALIISEIMYNPEGVNGGRIWVEIFNDTANDLNLAGWKFYEENVNHGLVAVQGSLLLPANGYAVIVDDPTKFKDDYPNYEGILLDSSISSLSDKGEPLSLKASTTAVPAYTINYSPYVSLGGDNDGSTLSFVAGTWVRGKATPGLENIAEEKIVTDSSTASSTGTTSTQATVAQMSPPSPDIVLYMPNSVIAVAGAESELKVSGMTRAGKEIEGLNFTWAFGDGGRGTGSSTKHTYVYTGRYVAQVEGSNSYIAGTGRAIVKVVPPDISIVDAGQGKYGTYVDIKNPNDYELDISQWAISIDGAVYPFPPNTIIAGNTTTRFAGASMGFATTAVHEGTVFKIQFPNLEQVTYFIPASRGQVAGVSTSSAPVLALVQATTSHPVTKPYATVLKKAALTITSQATTSPSSSSSLLSSKKNSKDHRLVSWFRSFFWR